ncbi:hypothetical protein V6N13_069567 [Hibiscus sabdariffa]
MLKKRNFSQVTDSDSFDLSQRFTEPYFLRKVLLEEMGDDGGSIHKLLAIAVHAGLVESGFVGFDPVSRLQTDRFRFPDEFLSPVSLCYSLPALLSNATDYVVLRFLSVGRFFQVYGSLVKGSGIHKLSLDEHRFSPRTHLALPACFVRLPTELKLKILGSLPGTDLARMECVCSEMRNLASSNDLWKQKVEQRFGHVCSEFEVMSRRKNWKLLFASLWMKGVYVEVYS